MGATTGALLVVEGKEAAFSNEVTRCSRDVEAVSSLPASRSLKKFGIDTHHLTCV